MIRALVFGLSVAYACVFLGVFTARATRDDDFEHVEGLMGLLVAIVFPFLFFFAIGCRLERWIERSDT